MKKFVFTLGGLLVLFLSFTAHALTMESVVDAAYVREHPGEFSVEVKRQENGLIAFTIRHDVPQAMFHVAQLSLYHQGRLLATSETPIYGRKGANTFHLALAPEQIAKAKFSLSDNGLAGEGAEALPIPGAIIHQFRLLDFVPKELLSASPKR